MAFASSRLGSVRLVIFLPRSLAIMSSSLVATTTTTTDADGPHVQVFTEKQDRAIERAAEAKLNKATKNKILEPHELGAIVKATVAKVTNDAESKPLTANTVHVLDTSDENTTQKAREKALAASVRRYTRRLTRYHGNVCYRLKSDIKKQLRTRRGYCAFSKSEEFKISLFYALNDSAKCTRKAKLCTANRLDLDRIRKAAVNAPPAHVNDCLDQAMALNPDHPEVYKRVAAVIRPQAPGASVDVSTQDLFATPKHTIYRDSDGSFTTSDKEIRRVARLRYVQQQATEHLLHYFPPMDSRCSFSGSRSYLTKCSSPFCSHALSDTFVGATDPHVDGSTNPYFGCCMICTTTAVADLDLSINMRRHASDYLSYVAERLVKLLGQDSFTWSRRPLGSTKTRITTTTTTTTKTKTVTTTTTATANNKPCAKRPREYTDSDYDDVDDANKPLKVFLCNKFASTSPKKARTNLYQPDPVSVTTTITKVHEVIVVSDDDSDDDDIDCIIVD